MKQYKPKKYELGVQKVYVSPGAQGTESLNKAIGYGTTGMQYGSQLGSLAGPMGGAIGAGIGLVGGGIYGAIQGQKDAQMLDQQRMKEQQVNSNIDYQNNNYGGIEKLQQKNLFDSVGYVSNRDIMAKNGMKYTPKKKIEVEKDEMIFRKDPNTGKTMLVADFKGGQPHSKGGEDFLAQEGDTIYPGDMRNEIKSLVGPDGYIKDEKTFEMYKNQLPEDVESKEKFPNGTTGIDFTGINSQLKNYGYQLPSTDISDLRTFRGQYNIQDKEGYNQVDTRFGLPTGSTLTANPNGPMNISDIRTNGILQPKKDDLNAKNALLYQGERVNLPKPKLKWNEGIDPNALTYSDQNASNMANQQYDENGNPYGNSYTEDQKLSSPNIFAGGPGVVKTPTNNAFKNAATTAGDLVKKELGDGIPNPSPGPNPDYLRTIKGLVPMVGNSLYNLGLMNEKADIREATNLQFDNLKYEDRSNPLRKNNLTGLKSNNMNASNYAGGSASNMIAAMNANQSAYNAQYTQIENNEMMRADQIATQNVGINNQEAQLNSQYYDQNVIANEQNLAKTRDIQRVGRLGIADDLNKFYQNNQVIEKDAKMDAEGKYRFDKMEERYGNELKYKNDMSEQESLKNYNTMSSMVPEYQKILDMGPTNSNYEFAKKMLSEYELQTMKMKKAGFIK